MSAELEQLEEACGVFGIFAPPSLVKNEIVNVASLTSLALTGLQHRGQESAGITTADEAGQYHFHKGMGLVEQVFSKSTLSSLPGHVAIGHNRYSTAGPSAILCTQPFILKTMQGQIALAHNGQLTNHEALGQRVMQHGVGMVSDSDSEIIAQILCSPPPPPNNEHVHGIDFYSRMKAFMNMAYTAYSLVALCGGKMYAVRDPFGNRPLSIGKLRGLDEDVFVVASETCCFSAIAAELVREVLPGEIVEFGPDGFKSLGVVPRTSTRPYLRVSRSSSVSSISEAVKAAPAPIPSALCIFEYVYFSQPESIMEGQTVHVVRQRCGHTLAKEAFVEADVVSTVPTSATPAALGFAHASGIPYNEVLSKNRYIGRTFIAPDQRTRNLGVLKKFSPITDNIVGKRIIIVDDSIVRGTTMGPIIQMLRDAGAKEVHIRVASPPLKHPCYMGINIPTREELVANQVSMEDLAAHFGADSIAYLSIEGLKESVKHGARSKDANPGHCTACLTGDYPVELEW